MAITNGYASLNEVKAAARITDSVDDALLETATETASRMIDEYCERRFFTNGTETRTYTPDSFYVLSIDDVAGTAITLKTSSNLDGVFDVTWTASDFQAEPTTRLASGVPWPVTQLRAVGDYLFTPPSAFTNPARNGVPDSAQVTAVFGFATAVPTQVKHATIILALRQFKRYDSPTGLLGVSDFGPIRVGSKMDPDVAMILNPYRRNPVGAA